MGKGTWHALANVLPHLCAFKTLLLNVSSFSPPVLSAQSFFWQSSTWLANMGASLLIIYLLILKICKWLYSYPVFLSLLSMFITNISVNQSCSLEERSAASLVKFIQTNQTLTNLDVSVVFPLLTISFCALLTYFSSRKIILYCRSMIYWKLW